MLPLLGVACINAFFLKPALSNAAAAYESAGEATAVDQRIRNRVGRLRIALRRTVLLDLGLGVAVIASVAVLAQTTTAAGEIAQREAAEQW